MSNNLIIDCSFFMSSILPDEDTESNFNLLDYDIIVPSIFYLECLNVINSALNRRRIDDKAFAEYLNILSDFPCRVDDFSSRSESLYLIHRICNQYNITSYDASYLELAIRLNAKIITHDRKLMAACQSAKITII